jgi:ElaB/YqjD/DUF883 family membrane-anchored ribosome-binding protein
VLFEKVIQVEEQTYKRAAADFTQSVGEMADTAKTQAAKAVDTAQTAALDTVGDLEKRIRDNPTQSALVAAGIGLVLGILLSR